MLGNALITCYLYFDYFVKVGFLIYISCSINCNSYDVNKWYCLTELLVLTKARSPKNLCVNSVKVIWDITVKLDGISFDGLLYTSNWS